jgi:hypothetical protein
MNVFPVGLAGEVYVRVPVDNEADEVTAVYLSSGDLTLVLTADPFQELDRAVNGTAVSEQFSLSQRDETFVVSTCGNGEVSITLDLGDPSQFLTLMRRVQKIIEPLSAFTLRCGGAFASPGRTTFGDCHRRRRRTAGRSACACRQGESTSPRAFGSSSCSPTLSRRACV